MAGGTPRGATSLSLEHRRGLPPRLLERGRLAVPLVRITRGDRSSSGLSFRIAETSAATA